MNGTFFTPTQVVLAEVEQERQTQERKWGEQNHPDGTGREIDRVTAAACRATCQRAAAAGKVSWRHILAEQVYKAFGKPSPDMLRAELVQVAAVACAWVEAIDRRLAATPAVPAPAGPVTTTAVRRLYDFADEPSEGAHHIDD